MPAWPPRRIEFSFSARLLVLRAWLRLATNPIRLPTMKPTTRYLTAALLAAGLAGTARAADRLIIDFADYHRDPDGRTSQPYEYAYQDWSHHVNPLPGKGTVVKSPSGKGGLGENKPAEDFEGCKALNVVLVIGNGNAAKSLAFSLTDKDGTEWAWNLPLEDKSRGVALSFHLDLGKPDYEQKPGKTPGINLKKLISWQVRGDFSALGVEVLLLKVTGA